MKVELNKYELEAIVIGVAALVSMERPGFTKQEADRLVTVVEGIQAEVRAQLLSKEKTPLAASILLGLAEKSWKAYKEAA